MKEVYTTKPLDEIEFECGCATGEQAPEFYSTPRGRLLSKIDALRKWMYQSIGEYDDADVNLHWLLATGCIHVGLIFKQNDSHMEQLQPKGEDDDYRAVALHTMQFLIDPETGEMEQYVTATSAEHRDGDQSLIASHNAIGSFIRNNFLID